MSDPPPAVKPVSMRIGFTGKSAAAAIDTAANATASASPRVRTAPMDVMDFSVC
jgi:hypothetical protein